ncbi:MAG: hypothetical protein H0V17_22380 [Deltaproteobacteria bacterium]|nr:hypothetical protein [Deltaproteobacteria bacterium]
MIVEAMRNRRVVVATGAFVTAGVVTDSGPSAPGDIVTIPRGAEVKLHIKVQAPPWQPLSSIRIYDGTMQVAAIALDSNATETIRFEGDVAVPRPTIRSTWVVRVELAEAGAPVLRTRIASFTNPIIGVSE